MHENTLNHIDRIWSQRKSHGIFRIPTNDSPPGEFGRRKFRSKVRGYTKSKTDPKQVIVGVYKSKLYKHIQIITYDISH